VDISAVVTELASRAAKMDVPVHGGTRLKEDLGLDSFALTSLIVDVEERLDIEIDLSLLSADNLETVDDLRALAENSVRQSQ